MANIKSQKKRNLTNEKARLRNRSVRSELKTAVRSVQVAVEDKNGAEAYAAALKTCRLLDRAVTKGVIHKRQAANRKSGVMTLANQVVTEEDRKSYTAPAKQVPVKKDISKKAEAKAVRQKEMEAASKEKDKRRAESEKSQAAAAKKKAVAEKKAAAEAEAAAKAEAEAAAAAEKAAAAEEAAASDESPAEEAEEASKEDAE